jgi:hypothetical protein
MLSNGVLFADNPDICYVCSSKENLCQADEDIFLCDHCDIEHSHRVFTNKEDWNKSIEQMKVRAQKENVIKRIGAGLALLSILETSNLYNR